MYWVSPLSYWSNIGVANIGSPDPNCRCNLRGLTGGIYPICIRINCYHAFETVTYRHQCAATDAKLLIPAVTTAH